MGTKFDCPLLDFGIVEYPMVMASFVSKSGRTVGGAFMVDTASRHNVMNEAILGLGSHMPRQWSWACVLLMVKTSCTLHL